MKQMDCDELWGKLIRVIESLPEARPGAGVGWREFYTKLDRRRNLILLEDDGLQRIATGIARPISKEEIYDGFAAKAMNADDHCFCIGDETIQPAFMGCLVCSLLDELPEFDYLDFRILRYNGPVQ